MEAAWKICKNKKVTLISITTALQFRRGMESWLPNKGDIFLGILTECQKNSCAQDGIVFKKQAVVGCLKTMHACSAVGQDVGLQSGENVFPTCARNRTISSEEREGMRQAPFNNRLLSTYIGRWLMAGSTHLESGVVAAADYGVGCW